MFRYELQKIFAKTSSRLLLVLLLAGLAIFSYNAVVSVSYVDKDGNSHTGPAAARALHNEKMRWAGPLDDDTLRAVLAANEAVIASADYQSKDTTANNRAYARAQNYKDIRELINNGFSDFQTYDYYRIDSVAPEDVGELYERRVQNLEAWLDDKGTNNFSAAEKAFLVSQYQKVDTPFVYAPADGWSALFEWSPSIIAFAAMVLVFLVAGIFSAEARTRADAIFFSSQYGRSKAVRAKVLAGLTTITVLYWLLVGLFCAIILGLLGTSGASTVIQTNFGLWKSIYTLTYIQAAALIFIGGYLGTLFLLSLAMWIAAKARSSLPAIIVPYVALFVPNFLLGIADNFPALEKLLGLLPDQLLQVQFVLHTFNLYTLGDHVLPSLPLLFILYTLLTLLLIPALYRTYRRTQVR